MNRFIPPLYLALLTAFVQPAAPALAQAGIVLKTFPLKAGKLLLDPGRPLLYATLPADNSLAVINTDTNTVVTTFFIGSNPESLALSPDGTRLYVGNLGSTTAGIGVVDLTTLTVLPSLPTSAPVDDLAAGLGNRLYLLTSGTGVAGTAGITQVDATTGAFQATLPGRTIYDYGALAISPDDTTLFYGNTGVSPSTLASFDVSGTTPALLQESAFDAVGSNGEGLIISHNGEYLVYPNGGGNSTDPAYTTSLIPTSNLDGATGTFATGGYPGLAAFSTDDSKLYQVQISGDIGTSILKVFSVQTFTLLDSFDLPGFAAYEDITSLAVTSPNGYLYVAGTDDTSADGPNDLLLISTQAGPFFNGSVALSGGFYYLQFASGNLFGYYNFDSTPYLYHSDLGFEYPVDAADGSGGLYLYDFKSSDFFYTSPNLFPYLYDFDLNAFLYYYPDSQRAGHYTTNPRYFFNFATGKIIKK